MSYILLIILGAVMFFTPYLRGLFFDSDFYLVSLVVLGCFLAWALYVFIKKKAITGVYGAIFLIPMMYLLAFMTAESPAFNFDNLFRWLAYACFFVMLVEMRKEVKVARWIPYVFLATGVAIGLFSYFGYLGWINYRDIVLSDRLSGPFQYPNTLAAVMGAYWLYSLMMTIRHSAPLREKVMYSATLVLFGTTFFLSFSRGALIVLPAAWFIGLILLRSKGQWLLILYTLSSGLLSLFMMVLSNGQAWIALLILLVCSTVPVAVTIWMTKRAADESWKLKFLEKHGRWATPAVILILGALLVLDLLNQGLIYRTLPASIQDRVSSISLETGSVLGRMNFYNDALRISQHYPLLGAGGEGWRILYGQYQSEPYLSNEIHNGYLEVLMNIGLIGTAVFLMVFVLLIIGMFKQRARQDTSAGQTASAAMVSAVSMLFIHAFLDFNFSFGTYWFILLWLLAMAVPVEGKLFMPKRQLGSDQLRKYVALTSKIVIVLLVLVAVVFNARVYAASSKAKINNKMTMNEVVDRFESAFGLNPYNVNYGLNLASLYAQYYANTQDESMKQQAIDIINKVLRLEPNNSKALFTAGEVYLRWMDWDQAIAYMDQAIAKEPFEVQFYNRTITLKQQIGARYADDAEESAVADYERYEAWYSLFKDRNLPDKRNIVLDRQSLLAAARAYAKLGETDRALTVLQPFNPVLDEGIVDSESRQVLADSFEILSLAELLDQYGDRTIIITVKGTAVRRLSSDTIVMLKKMGSSIDQLADNGSYIAIISGGQLLQELIDNNGDVTLTNETANSRVKSLFGSHEVTIYSAGADHGNQASIQVDGAEYSRNNRGMNIAVFDRDMALVGTIDFDTHLSEVRVVH